jgi:hypothetical protein
MEKFFKIIYKVSVSNVENGFSYYESRFLVHYVEAFDVECAESKFQRLTSKDAQFIAAIQM